MSTDQRMSDEECICEFMEPKPPDPTQAFQQSPEEWWLCRYSVAEQKLVWITGEKVDSLDALHEVEERVIVEMPHNFWLKYEAALQQLRGQLVLWHADAPTRIKALATVLRPDVEGRER